MSGDPLQNLALDVSVKPGTHREIVLGIATSGANVVAVGGQGRDLFLTSTDGETFRTGRSPNGGLRTAWLEDDVWVVGEYGYAARSRDGGATWEKIATGKWKKYGGPCLFGIVRDVAGDGAMWMGGDGGFLARSTDGVTFKKVGGSGEPIGRMTASPLGVLIPTDAGHVFVARGRKIEKLGAEAGGELMMARVTPHGTIVAVGSGVAIRSTDRGATFEKMPVSAGLLAGVDVLADGRIVVVGDGGAIFVSNDEGASFTKLAQHVSNGQLWCVCRYGSGALIGGTAGVVFRLTDTSAPAVVAEAPRVAVGVAVPPPPKPPANPAWAAPPPSTTRQEWKPKALPIEKKNGVFWTPALRALIHPRRGGIDTGVRPLPTLEEAWARFRRAAWADDKVGMERKSKPSTIWEWVTSYDAASRRRGERLLDVAPRRASFEDDAALLASTLEQYGGFPMQFHEDLWEAVADFLVADEGLPEALRRAYVGLKRELPYTGVGPFGRFRELLAIADDATYADAKAAILESFATEWEKSKNETHRGPDLKWTTTFLLPLGPLAGDDERRIHEDAMKHVKKFGDFGVHACGLAAGDVSTIQRFLHANERVRHEFFAGQPHRHIAAVLDVDGAGAAKILAKMKLAPPFEDSAAENVRWTELLAHLDDEDALEALYAERARPVSSTWGISGLLTAARLDFDRVMDLAKRKKDDELVQMLERERGKPPEAPPADVEDPNIAPLAAPSDYAPPPAVRPTMLQNPLGLEPEVVFRDAETENAQYDRPVSWDGAPLQGAKPEVLEAFVAHCEKWAIGASLDVVAATPTRVHERLFALGFDQRQTYWARYCMRPILVKHGAAAVPVLVATLANAEMLDAALAPAQGIGDVSVAPAMIEAFAGKKNKTFGRSWMLRHPRHAAAGALELFARDENMDAARALRFLDVRGHRDTIVSDAEKMGVRDVVVAMLDRDPLTQPKVKKPVLPKWLDASTLPPLTRTRDELDALLVQLAYSNADEIHPGVLAARRTYAPEARAAFAWSLFESWMALGADPKQSWCMQAVGFLGDDDCARKLAALAKAWPGEGASARAQAALDALLNIGTDTALLNINLLAEKSKFPAFKAAAGERIVTIADMRGLTTDELADRLVPTLGLDEMGASELDYGTRKFTVWFDERLAPVVKDASGAVLADLPKPSKTDDAARAKAAKAKLAGLKKDAKATASLQITRMERAMRTGRLVDGRLFADAFVHHPWMRHLAQRLVWGAHDASGALVSPFRIAEDGTFADSKDAEYTLSGGASVSVLHPVRMPADTREAFAAVFADYAIVQPFPQLGRPLFEVSADERGARRLERFRGRKASYGALRALEARGWQRWMDDAVRFAKPIRDRLYAELETEPGWHPSQSAEDIEPQTLGDVVLPEPLTFGALDAVDFSELVYDLETVTSA